MSPGSFATPSHTRNVDLVRNPRLGEYVALESVPRNATHTRGDTALGLIERVLPMMGTLQKETRAPRSIRYGLGRGGGIHGHAVVVCGCSKPG